MLGGVEGWGRGGWDTKFRARHTAILCCEWLSGMLLRALSLLSTWQQTKPVYRCQYSLCYVFGAGWGWVRSAEERQAVRFGKKDEGNRPDYEERQETDQVLFWGRGESQGTTHEISTLPKWQEPSPWCQRIWLTSWIL